MSGGYLYAQAQTDQVSTSMNKRDWALIIHKTRCSAFLQATGREVTGSWTSIQTNIQNEFSDTIIMGGGVVSTVYIQDYHPESLDQSKNYPAFVSFFKHPTSNAEYCIITSNGFNTYPNYRNYGRDNLDKGLYLGKENVMHHADFYCCAKSMMHAFSKNGFGSYDVGDDAFLTPDSTFIYPCYTGNFADAPYWNYSMSFGVDDYHSILYAVGNSTYNGYSWVFGYAVKGNQIECFMRQNGQTHWQWSIIGEIVGIPRLNTDTHLVGGAYFTWNEYEIDSINFNDLTNLPNNTPYTYSLTDNNGNQIIILNNLTSSNSRVLRFNGINGGVICARTSNQTPSDIEWCAFPLGYALNKNYTVPDNQSFDGHGSGFKGWVDTNLLRVVAPQFCQTDGATFGNGNFVSMYAGNAYHGYILGWDSSNPSII